VPPPRFIASATFWTALWGPIGLVLATPLTVCLVVLGRHVERLEFLDVMFGDRPALSAPEIFCQRMLACDPTEAAEKAEEFLKERSLSSYYDEVALKGLQLAQVDVERGAISQRRPETDAASERFAIMAEHSTSVLIENSIQIAWDFLARSREIEDPVIASRFLCDSIELMVRQGVRNQLLLSRPSATWRRLWLLPRFIILAKLPAIHSPG